MSKYLNQACDEVVEWKDHGKFTEAEAAALVSVDPLERFLERSSDQDRVTLKMIPYCRVRVGATSLDRARRNYHDQRNVHQVEGIAQSLAKPYDAKFPRVSEFKISATRGEVTHRLQFTRPTPSYDFYAAFTPSVEGKHVFVYTTNWKCEDEYHDWVTIDTARALYRAMVKAGYEVM